MSRSDSDPLPAVACSTNCLGHDHEDCTGDSRRVSEIPFDLFDFDLDRWRNALDCDGIENRLPFDAELHFTGAFDLDNARHWRPDGDCDGPRCALSGPYYTPCTYADCDLELGGGCVLRGQRA